MMQKKFFYLLPFLITSTTFALQTNNNLQTLTEQILQYQKTSLKNLTTQEFTKFVNQAKQRLENLQNNLDNPVIIRYLLPQKMTRNFSGAAQNYFEEEVTDLIGTIEVRAALYLANDKQNPTQYLLHVGNNTYRLHFEGNAPDLQTDMKVRIKRGFYIPSKTSSYKDLIVVKEDVIVLKKLTELPYSFGPQSTIAILVNFIDKPSEHPWTPDTIKDLVFNKMNNLYDEASYHQTSIVGDKVAGWFVINTSSADDCDTITNNIPTQALAAAQAAGIDISQYRRRIYFFPYTGACGWAGLGTVGGSQPSNAWINGYNNLQVVAHEVGHNVGLMHAQALRCTTSPIEGTCTTSEYGDGSDTMGNIHAAHFNAFEKDRLGWLNYGVSPPITTVTKSGSYFIDAYETANNRVKALKVLKRTGQNVYYYLEFRQPIGIDNSLVCTGCDYTQGIVFHQGDPAGYNKSQLLDMTPGSGNQTVALLPCQSWTDSGAPNGGVTFAVESISSKGARVKITYGTGTSTCQRATPTIKLVNGYTPWLNQYESTTTQLEIINNDSGKCTPRNFNVTLNDMPSYFTTNFSKPNIEISAGSTGKIEMLTKSAYGSLPTFQQINVAVKNNVDKAPVILPVTIGLNG